MFFEKLVSFFSFKNTDINIKDNKKVRNFVMFFGSILFISIIISIIYHQIGYLVIYAGMFILYDRQLIFNSQLKDDFKNIILRNKYCKLLYLIYVLIWVIVILIYIFLIIKVKFNF